ncbi:MAG: Mandelate racemase/muconate lactonizing protein [Frankiales bacterium]|nr:Mandelate racemase/muconate lactonizing protein [Frankiales bacterium]
MLTLEAHVVALPMRVPFRGVTTREAMLIRTDRGWGEFAPFVEYADAEAALWLAAGLDHDWPAPVRLHVPVNATVPAVPASQVAEVLARFPGCTTAKVKVAQAGQSLRDDVDRVAAVRELVPNVRVDANAAWTVDEAVTAITALGELEYVEQPCASVDDLAAVRRRVSTRIAADESIRKATDPLLVARKQAADVVVLKVAPLGGVRAALRVAEQCGLPVVVSSALDTSIGIRAGVALAAALPELPFACGLATTSLMAADVVVDSLDGRGGSIPVRDVVPDPSLLARYAAPREREQWWRDRLARVLELLP